MKKTLLIALLGIGFLATGCSTAYQSDQTPDDVYYSPGKPGVSNKDLVRDQVQKEQYETYLSSSDDAYLRMKVANYSRWNSLDDYSYWYDSRYDFHRYNYYNSLGWNNYNWNSNWNYALGWGGYRPSLGWSNPTHTIISYFNSKSTIGTTSGSAITAYRNKNYGNTNATFTNAKTGVTSISNNTNNFSDLVRKVFSSSSSSSSNNNSWDRPARTFSNSSSTQSYSSPSSSPSTSSSAGGNSGGVKSTGSSSSSGRTTRN